MPSSAPAIAAIRSGLMDRSSWGAFVCAMPVILAGLGNGFVLETTQESPVWYWIADAVQWVIIPAACLLLLKIHYQGDYHSYGLGFRSLLSRRNFMCTCLALALFLLMVFPGYGVLWTYLWTIDDLTKIDGNPERMMPSGIVAAGAVALYRSITAGFVEEVFFRGLLRHALIGSVATERNVLSFLAFSSILFGLAHWEAGVTAIVTFTVLGVFAGLLYLFCNSLWPLIAGHVATDVAVHLARGI